MDIKHHTHPDQLETYSFWWSEARLIIAAVALLAGGIPPVFLILGAGGIVWPVLKLCWIISGLASAYMAYRWYAGGQRLFGKHDTWDKVAFFVSVISGINLGLAGLLGSNIGMSILNGRFIFTVAAVIYVVSAWRLYSRYSDNGKRIF